MKMTENKTTVRVTLTDREDGGLRVSSSDLIGLILSGSDRSAVTARIVPAIRALCAQHGFEVVVTPPRPLHEVLNSPSPRTVSIHIQEQVYIVELRKAA